MILVLFLSILLAGGSLSGAVIAFAAEGGTVFKTFSQLTEDEKERVLQHLVNSDIVPASISIGSGRYSLNQALWKQKGIVAYGVTANVNAANQAVGSPNYKDGQYRYWGYDMNGGLYGNDDFPRDSDSGRAAYAKDWLTVNQIKANQTAAGYMGQFALKAGFSGSDRRHTAAAFLDENPAWRNAGKTEDYILEHFYFNAVLTESGMTQGQFIGVHKSIYDGRLYYQTFSVEGGVTLYEVPPEVVEDPGVPEEEPEMPPPLPEPGEEISVSPTLALPPVTYVGHPVLAEDYSVFFVGEETWSAARAYAEGMATNRFTASGGSASKLSHTKARIVYQSEGSYSVVLRVTPQNGSPISVAEPIQVMKTPDILHGLTGTLKQNRKMTLNISVAQNPDHKIKTLWIKLEHPETGETVTLRHNIGGQNILDNGPTIKTRPIEPLDSSEYFLNCRLEFLTKNTENTDYRYTVYAEDTRGESSLVTSDFSVAKDRAPEALVHLESSYVRKQGRNQAEIIVEDGTLTDGDQIERAWYYRAGSLCDSGNSEESPDESGSEGSPEWTPVETMPGYADHSFGTGKKVAFEKEGVGPLSVKLVVRDVWTEDTLPEYISEEDYLTGEAVAGCEVVNVAPVVSMSPLTARTAGITILAGSSAEHADIKAELPALKQELLRQGVDADINLEKMVRPVEEPGSGPAKRIMSVDTSFGYEGGWTFYENDNFIVDEERLFKIDATWVSPAAGNHPESPYTITCWEAVSGRELWRYTFTDELLAVPRARQGPYFAQDDSGRYLFFVADGKSLILSKDNGSLLTLADFPVGKNVFAEDQAIYTLKEDGIYSMSTRSGQVRKIYNGRIMDGTAKRLSNRVHFVTWKGEAFYRGIFDPKTEKVVLEGIMGSPSVDGITQYRLLGVDGSGKLAINTVTRGRDVGGTPNNTYTNRTWIYGGDNRLLLATPTLSDTVQGRYHPTLIYDEEGICSYIAYTWEQRNRVEARLYGIENGYTGSASLREGDETPSVSSRIPFARQIGEKVYLSTGAQWIWVLNAGYNIYEARTRAFIFDPPAGTVQMGKHYGEMGIPNATVEYGFSSDTIAAVQTGNNHVGLPEGSETHVLAWYQPPSSVISRYVNKSFDGRKDINALIICDGINLEEKYGQELLREIEEKIDRDNGRLIIASPENLEGKLLGERILDKADGEKNILSVFVSPGQVGSVSKTYSLKPNTKYYYEYEIRNQESRGGDVMKVNHKSSSPAGALFDTDGYRTGDSFYEDFSDEVTNPFYTLNKNCVGEGYYKGADLTITTDSNRYRSAPSPKDSTAIRFTIPPDSKGVLVMDYRLEKEYENEPGQWMSCYVMIDGKMWTASVPNSGKGRYSHPHLLEPGEHTLTFHAGAYGRKYTYAKMWIDSLRVDLVEDGLPADGIGAGAEIAGIETLSQGYTRMTGSFHTPSMVASYGQVENAEVIDGPVGRAAHTVWKNTEAGSKSFDFNIPGGKTALHTLVSTHSRPAISSAGRNYTVNYSMPFSYDASNRKWRNYKWDSYFKITSDSQILRNVPVDFRLSPGTLTEPKTFSQNSSAYRGAYGDFTNVFSVLVDSGNAAWKDKDSFLTGAGADRKYFLEKDVYQDTTLTFALAEGSHYLRGFKVYELRDGVKIYAANETFSHSDVLSEWQEERAQLAILGEAPGEKEEERLVYRKNEAVLFQIGYFDYEDDPSKREYWRYTHTPANDGPHPDAAVILDEDNNLIYAEDKVLDAPLQRFSIDGKYTVEHWQEDNTARPPVDMGNPDYDKLSNVEVQTFYIEGGASAPWIESISTIPRAVKEGDFYRLQIRVDDAEKDELSLTTEIYRGKQLTYAHRKSHIRADASGRYPAVLTDMAPLAAELGTYEVICTVRDGTGVGLGSYKFTVVSEGSVRGRVFHTEEWDQNRKKYNLSLFGEEYNSPVSYSEYLAMSPPRKRGTNVFWAGERFLLSAEAGGSPKRVTAEILGTPGYKAVLESTGRKNQQGETVYQGELWDRSMLDRWGRREPTRLTFRFTAEYEGGLTKTFDEEVIVDSSVNYWLLHRLW